MEKELEKRIIYFGIYGIDKVKLIKYFKNGFDNFNFKGTNFANNQTIEKLIDFICTLYIIEDEIIDDKDYKIISLTKYLYDGMTNIQKFNSYEESDTYLKLSVKAHELACIIDEEIYRSEMIIYNMTSTKFISLFAKMVEEYCSNCETYEYSNTKSNYFEFNDTLSHKDIIKLTQYVIEKLYPYDYIDEEQISNFIQNELFFNYKEKIWKTIPKKIYNYILYENTYLTNLAYELSREIINMMIEFGILIDNDDDSGKYQCDYNDYDESGEIIKNKKSNDTSSNDTTDETGNYTISDRNNFTITYGKSGELYEIDKLDEIVHEGKPYVCPICGGSGMVDAKLYNNIDEKSTALVTGTVKCRTCNGSGVLWSGKAFKK